MILTSMGYGLKRKQRESPRPSMSSELIQFVGARTSALVVVLIMLGIFCVYVLALGSGHTSSLAPVPARLRSADPPRASPEREAHVVEPTTIPTASEFQTPPAPPARMTPKSEPANELFRLALSHQIAGEFEKAIRLYQVLLARSELRAQVYNNLALIYQQRGRVDEATRHFERAILDDPSYARAHNNFGTLLLARNRTDEALMRFRIAAELDPRNPDALVNLGLAYKAAGSLLQAQESLLAALTLSPHSAPAHYNLAVLYDQAGENARALEHYRAFLERRGDDHAPQVAGVLARITALDTQR
jgi:Tfp pilus assembly protein PilF